MKALYIRLLMFLMVSITVTSSVYGAHLVGGDISYECMGNNKYQVRLRVYRDCADPRSTDFDEFATIAIYDDASTLLRQLRISGRGRTRVPDSTGNPCVIPPPGLCTEYFDYIDTVTLPPRLGGYILTWQRCCRNRIIKNIPAPEDKGSTYTVQIPSNDTQCNSSPFIENVPPIGDPAIPSPSSPPPYREIPFIAPNSATNPIPASIPFTINPQTGILSGVPNEPGTYVVGICISDYDQGKLLSKVRLDYQFNVTDCIKATVSDMLTPLEDPTILCDGLTVDFTSQSNSADVFWDFGVPGVNTDTSSLLKPTFTFPGPGAYKVTLYAGTKSPCGDTTEFIFNVSNPELPEFFWTGQTCFEAQAVDFRPITGFPAGTTYLWEFDSTAAFPTFTQPNPPIQSWSVPGKHYISLSVKVGFCTYTKRDSIEISYLSANVDAGPNQTVSLGEWARLRATGGSDYYWYADDEVEMSSRITANTLARMEEVDTVKFYVRARDEFGCEGLDSTLVFVLNGDAPGPINFFSPNRDGVNDEFDLKSINPDNAYSLVIFNRWGSEVWSVKEYQNDWSGVDYGYNELPDGTYYYILHDQGEVIYKSAITLMRDTNGRP